MARLASLSLAIAAVLAADLSAQSVNPPSILAPKEEPPARPEAPRRSRGISPEVAAQLSAAAPKYAPTPPKPEPKPEEEQVDAREVDKPRNAIIRLPKYIVREPKPPIFNERAISTEKGIKDIAMRRYISDVDRALNRFRIPLAGGFTVGGANNSTEARALAMYAEDERLQNMADMKDAAGTVSKSDAAQGAYILRESQKTYMRTSDFGWRNDNKR